MSFTLNLGFAGLCLFVKDGPDPEYPDQLHTLLPADAGHAPRLIYDQACELAAQVRTNVPRVLGLENTLIDLTQLATTAATVPVQPPPVLMRDVTELTGRQIPRKFFRDAFPGSAVTARVSFAKGAASIPAGAEGAVWTLRGAPVQLAIRAVWTMEVEGTSLVLNLDGLNETGAKPSLTLYPTADNVLDLWIFNTPPNEVPATLPPQTRQITTLQANAPANHFATYYQLTGPEVPLFQSFTPPAPAAGQGGQPSAAQAATSSSMGTDVTCAGAQGHGAPAGPG